MDLLRQRQQHPSSAPCKEHLDNLAERFGIAGHIYGRDNLEAKFSHIAKHHKQPWELKTAKDTYAWLKPGYRPERTFETKGAYQWWGFSTDRHPASNFQLDNPPIE